MLKIRTSQPDPNLPSERLFRALKGSEAYWLLFKKMALYPTVETKSLSLLYDMAKANPDGMLVGEIERKIRVPHAQVSLALGKLRKSGLVESTKEGTAVRNWVPDHVLAFLDHVVLSVLGQRTDQVTLPSQRLLEAVKKMTPQWTLFVTLVKRRQHFTQFRVFTLLYDRFFEPDSEPMTVAELVKAVDREEDMIRRTLDALVWDGLLVQEEEPGKSLRFSVPVEVADFLTSYTSLALDEVEELPAAAYEGA